MITSAPERLAVCLRDGTPVWIRPIRLGDFELERRFVEGLSPRTGYQRLLSGRHPTTTELERWTDVDPARDIGLIAAIVGDTEQQLGVARCALEEGEPIRWDFAVVVGDA